MRNYAHSVYFAPIVCYFNIGEKKLRQIVSEHINTGFVIQNGVKTLIKRSRFEAFLDKTSAL